MAVNVHIFPDDRPVLVTEIGTEVEVMTVQPGDQGSLIITNPKGITITELPPVEAARVDD